MWGRSRLGAPPSTRPVSPTARSVPTSPPPGSYDPAIDAQVGQAQRGYRDLFSDYLRDFGEPGTALGGRRGEDFTLGREDVERDYGRSLADILTGRTRTTQNYQRGVEGLERNYAQLGAAQTQAARAAGVARGGALAQALAKRTANKAIQRQDMDTAQTRAMEDSGLQESRLGENRGLALGALSRGYLRDVDDAGVGLGRAGRENLQFGLDAAAQRFYQANLPLPGGGPEPAGPSSSARPKRKPRVPGPRGPRMRGGR